MIFQGDCLEHLKTLEANSIDSLVTDPPAGISFMGKEWDHGANFIERMSEIYRDCLRVLKPGAHGLVWALPRTSHWTATALELAGFEIRDVVTHVFGSGFPKSLDISKAIDKAAGAEREVIGKLSNPSGGLKTTYLNNNNPESKYGWNGDALITSPATSEAKEWQGWGTALKPASEHWILVRKPLAEKTVAANVLKHGTGGINIDASRVGSEDMSKQWDRKWNDNSGEFGARYPQSGRERNKQVPPGRFPANFILSHNEDCDETCTEGCAVKMLDEQSGVSKSTGGGGTKVKFGENNIYGKSKEYTQPKNCGLGDSGGASRFFFCARPDVKHAIKSLCNSTNANNAEQSSRTFQEIEQTVSILFAQESATQLSDLANRYLTVKSAESNATNTELDFVLEAVRTLFKKDLHSLHSLVFTLEQRRQTQILNHAITVALLENTGTTPTIQNLSLLNGFAFHVIESIITWESEDQNSRSHQARFRYCPKASKKDRNEGLEGMPEKPTGRFQANRKCKICGYQEISGSPCNCASPDWEKIPVLDSKNFHPTVKSTKLMQYLIKLITPPGGRVLDPFMGSGSTCVAAIAVGCLFTGIEKDPEYFAIAEKRIGV